MGAQAEHFEPQIHGLICVIWGDLYQVDGVDADAPRILGHDMRVQYIFLFIFVSFFEAHSQVCYRLSHHILSIMYQVANAAGHKVDLRVSFLAKFFKHLIGICRLILFPFPLENISIRSCLSIEVEQPLQLLLSLFLQPILHLVCIDDLKLSFVVQVVKILFLSSVLLQEHGLGTVLNLSRF